MTEEQKYEISNVADDMELEGQERDLFLKEAIIPEHEAKINYEVERINQAYQYYIAELYEVLKMIRKKGFILNFVKTIDLDINDFENLAISNEFQELTGIAKIDNWEEYIFPVDFFDNSLASLILCASPPERVPAPRFKVR